MRVAQRENEQWVEEQLKPLPFELQRKFRAEYNKSQTMYSANTQLRQSVDTIRKVMPQGFAGIPLDYGEDDLRSMAKDCSEHCHQRAKKFPYLKQRLIPLTAFPVNGFSSSSKPVNEYVNDIVMLRNLYVGLKGYAESKDVALPNVANPIGSEKAIGSMSEEAIIKHARFLLTTIAKLKDYSWWLRQLRKAHNRKVEKACHAANIVNKYWGIYASDISVNRRAGQIARNQKMLEEHEAVNESGDRFTLAELSDKNVSNPVNRRNELMVRIRGTEDFAKQEGLVGVFLTITCPLKYHRSFSKSGEPNPKWEGFTPKDGQDYLNILWQRIRAAFQREQIYPLGIRVAEPQHDGTPHWHLLLFTEANQVDEMISICRDYAMREDGNEPGAEKYRFDAKLIDAKKGSATGYIAKYICKNIDGSNLESGIYGEDPIEAAQRVETWRSVWGIRQFEFIGGCSVTTWRELRRLSKESELPEEVEAIRHAADESDWCKFNQLMGGFFCKRKEQTLRPHYSFKFDASTGEVKESKYGDSFIERLVGLKYKAQTFITRLHQWSVEKIGTARVAPLGVL
ncbi:MAG: replication endonuclease [Cytophagia bacterium]|nr:replication endonuclease [Cytophagia bacterium]